MATARPKGKGYEIRVSCGYDMNGRKITQSKTWIPEKNMTPKQLTKELERQKTLYEEEIRAGKSMNGNVRFHVFADKWLADYAEKHIEFSTKARYMELLKRINPAIGHIKLKDLKPLHLNAFYRNLSENGINKKKFKDENGNLRNNGKLSPKTIMEHHRLISVILNTAVKWQLIDQNIAVRADPPKVPYKEINYLNEEETKQLIIALEEEPIQYRTMITLLIYTGLRRGELCGLEWKDIDFENRTLKVIRTSLYIGNKTLITKEPKTHSGKRMLTLSKAACISLQQYKVWQDEQKQRLGDRWTETGRLFTAWNGTGIYPDTVTSWFHDFLHRKGFRNVTLHSLRHTNATLMIADGTDVRTVSNRLGHAQTSTTLNIYTHALKAKDVEATSKLDSILNV